MFGSQFLSAVGAKQVEVGIDRGNPNQGTSGSGPQPAKSLIYVNDKDLPGDPIQLTPGDVAALSKVRGLEFVRDSDPTTLSLVFEKFRE